MDIHTQELRLRIHLICCRECAVSVNGPVCEHGRALWRGWMMAHRLNNRTGSPVRIMMLEKQAD